MPQVRRRIGFCVQLSPFITFNHQSYSPDCPSKPLFTNIERKFNPIAYFKSGIEQFVQPCFLNTRKLGLGNIRLKRGYAVEHSGY